jgi:hypothetical protein
MPSQLAQRYFLLNEMQYYLMISVLNTIINLLIISVVQFGAEKLIAADALSRVGL